MAAKKKAPAKRPASRTSKASASSQANDDTQGNQPTGTATAQPPAGDKPPQEPVKDSPIQPAGDDKDQAAPKDQGHSQQDENPVQDPDAEALEVMTRSASGFFRAGWKWGRQARKVALENFTDEQVQALEDEPELIVRRCKLGD